MLETTNFSLKMETIVHPVMIFKSPTRPVIKLFVVLEDLEAALLDLGSRDFRGTITIRLATPYYGKDTYANSRMDGIVFDVEGRTLSTAVITDRVELFTFARRSFTTYLRELIKEINKSKDNKE
ncbi:hypothetical protein pEaSNUABM10_00076 [Erwinia phage pEa_SNUABM_10]|nr:hypothetical protein pEaSNUABM10_00076 [Erwinia phage pEa_SNUABM_10]